MKKILHIIYGFYNGGVEKVLLDYIDANKYDVTILYLNDALEECVSKFMNVTIIKSKYNLTEKIKFMKYLDNYLKENKFDIIHCHLNKNNYFPLKIAYKNNIIMRISHSHGIDSKTMNIIKLIYRNMLKKGTVQYATKLVACSEKAGHNLYRKNRFSTIYNPIEIGHFKFDEIKRRKIRNRYGIDQDKIVIGHVGRFSYLKNHQFMFKLLKKLDQKYVLLLIGDGELKQKYIDLSNQLKLNKRIIFVGSIDCVNDYLSAMDIFLFPSINEGFGISLIESQANGLYTLTSSTMSKETKITNQIYYLNLQHMKKWKEYIEKFSSNNRKVDIKTMKFNPKLNKQIFNKLYE